MKPAGCGDSGALGLPRPISSSPFRLVHRGIGGVDQVLDDGPGLRVADIAPPDTGDADARGRAFRNRGDFVPQPFSDGLRFAGRRGLGDQELLTVDPCDDGAPAGGVPEFVGDRDQDPVAGRVARVSLTCLNRSRSSMMTVR